jgi:hypothetical protein
MKEKRPNPSPKSGPRNIFCPYYSSCLDTAIQSAWMSWDCHLCQERFNRGAEPEFALTVNHSIAYYELASGI